MTRHNIIAHFVVLFSIIIALQCQKLNSPTDQGDPRFYGKWNWVMTDGGDLFYSQIHPPPIVKIIFGQNNYCIYYRNDTIISERNYYLIRDSVWYTPDSVDMIKFTDIWSDTSMNWPKINWLNTPSIGEYMYSFTPSNDTLIFSDRWWHFRYTKN